MPEWKQLPHQVPAETASEFCVHYQPVLQVNGGGVGLSYRVKDLRNELSKYTANSIHQQVPLLLQFSK